MGARSKKPKQQTQTDDTSSDSGTDTHTDDSGCETDTTVDDDGDTASGPKSSWPFLFENSLKRFATRKIEVTNGGESRSTKETDGYTVRSQGGISDNGKVYLPSSFTPPSQLWFLGAQQTPATASRVAYPTRSSNRAPPTQVRFAQPTVNPGQAWMGPPPTQAPVFAASANSAPYGPQTMNPQFATGQQPMHPRFGQSADTQTALPRNHHTGSSRGERRRGCRGGHW